MGGGASSIWDIAKRKIEVKGALEDEMAMVGGVLITAYVFAYRLLGQGGIGQEGLYTGSGH